MGDFSEYYKARDTITDILQKDLIGPVTKDETIPELPTQYYIMGKLYPKNNTIDETDTARNPLLENSVETYDSSISLSNQKNPSSVGITFTLRPTAKNVKISGSYSFYDAIPYQNAIDLGLDFSKTADDKKPPEHVWSRKEYPYEVSLILDDRSIYEESLPRGMVLKAYTNKVFKDTGERVITVVLINENNSSNDLTETNVATAFQPSIVVTGNSNEPIFTFVDKKVNLTTDTELLEIDMLYQDVYCYAQGHGCSAEWDLENDEPLWVSSSFMPTFNLHQMKAAANPSKVFNMKWLFTEKPQTIIAELRTFMSEYSDWISGLEDAITNYSEPRKESALKNISRCQQAHDTICKTIDLLEEDSLKNGIVYKAFKLANEAMYKQRERSLIKEGKEIDPAKINWYPFQLAFILQEMISFIKPDWEDRKKVDLLWFPTGGGKTEAYLGISAFVIFLRRLRNKNDDGVTIIMRYTLRLLTLQQFERASMLICACELLRKEHNLGGSEISIGLWVGGGLTPNRLSDAKSSIDKQQNGGLLSGEDENPCQIKVCPWCGEHLGPDNYRVDSTNNRMYIKCSKEECDFHNNINGLPVHIIDDAIYEYLPTFIIATVDKFAQIPLSSKPAALFGITTGKKPPELIIQDELHLISGPLGTMTGIYEAAISKLCEHDGIMAKVIASTATIRNASFQIKALYGREYTQFPPQGISTKDSFFAEEASEEERPARKYCGIMGIGTTATTSLIRVNASLLFASRYLKSLGMTSEVIDSFWSIVGYFNSLRELGGASTQIIDDVQSRFGYLAKTKFVKIYPGVDSDKNYDNLVELTSRMNNDEITKIIQEGLKKSYPDFDAYDFVLASNMISVGVDVGRLGSMVVAGQPKTNAEYIQATSRVGRKTPGLVVTVYNSARSRDRSHYEQFLKYHSALYRYVEATSLTPFSDRARDRGLHALFIALCRYMIPGLLEDEDAVNFRADNPKVAEIRDMILNYVKIVDPEEYDSVKEELAEISFKWDDLAIGSLSYKWGKKRLLKGDIENDRFRTMNSMRNVDGQSGIYLMGRL